MKKGYVVPSFPSDEEITKQIAEWNAKQTKTIEEIERDNDAEFMAMARERNADPEYKKIWDETAPK